MGEFFRSALGLFLINVSVISVLLAIFEVAIEKNHGWATGFGKFWGKRYFEGGLVAKVCEKKYITRYHLTMFCLVLPCILYGEYLWVNTAPLILMASWIEIGVVEDFLWFVINWHFPGSLRKLLSGDIWWHLAYWKIGSIKLPRFYFFSTAWAVALLLIQYRLIG
jgi:hypothetical protein